MSRRNYLEPSAHEVAVLLLLIGIVVVAISFGGR